MTKTLREAIMHRSQLETNYLKTKAPKMLNLFKKQRNFCSKLYKKEGKNYFITDSHNSLDTAIKKYENHSSIKAINENTIIHEEFEFCFGRVSNISKEILNSNKRVTFKNIPAKRLKENTDICVPHLTNI